MTKPPPPANSRLLRAALAQQRGLIGALAVFSLFVNILFLTGPIFALQVYDRVLGSRSVETLVVLTILAAFLFLIMGLLDYTRRRIAARIGERLTTQLEEPTFAAIIHRNTGPLADLEIIRRFFGSALFVALFDLPWMPLFLIGIALFHPALGWLSLFGALVLLLPGILNLAMGLITPNSDPTAHKWAQLATDDRADIFGLNLKKTVYPRWQFAQHTARQTALKHQDILAVASSIGQTFRLFLQSAVIAVGAYFVLQNQLTAGAIIATSVLLWRALSPLDLISQNAAALHQFLVAWTRLSAQLAATKRPIPKSPAIRADTGLCAEKLTVFPPGASRAALRSVSFSLGSGQSIGITGPSGAGKTTLAYALLGYWPLAGGTIRIGGVPVGQIEGDDLHRQIGYLPQRCNFHDGSIEENISHFANDPDATALAASRAGAHDLIMALPLGYQTQLTAATNRLPGGLLQKLGIARAIYGRPSLLILDEPASDLDADGLAILQGLISEICKSGSSAVMISQRRNVLSHCDDLLTLDHGTKLPQLLRPRTTLVSVPMTLKADISG